MTIALGEQAVVCKERVDLQQARIDWENFFRGTTTMRGLVQGAWDPLVHGVP
jgi:hypothetical protein